MLHAGFIASSRPGSASDVHFSCIPVWSGSLGKKPFIFRIQRGGSLMFSSTSLTTGKAQVVQTLMDAVMQGARLTKARACSTSKFARCISSLARGGLVISKAGWEESPRLLASSDILFDDKLGQAKLSCWFGLVVWVFLITLYFDQRKNATTLINLKNHQWNYWKTKGTNMIKQTWQFWSSF